MALFGEKYGDEVRTVEVPGFSPRAVRRLPRAQHRRDRPLLITGERGVASGVRRIEAVAGRAALDLVRQRQEMADEVERALGAPLERAPQEVEGLRGRLREAERELAELRRRLVAGDGGAEEGLTEVEGVKVLVREAPGAPAGELRDMADMLRQRLGSGVVVLASRGEGKVALVVAVSDDLADRVPAGDLVKAVAAHVGGGGGGRPQFAQAGGREPEKLPQALAAAPEEVRRRLRRDG
jgi:alanyl-tRNA synthetase